MDNKERLDLLNTNYKKLSAHSQTIQNCSKQADDLLSRLEQIKLKLIKKEGDVADDFKEIHEQHIQNTKYIEQLQLYEQESINFKQSIDRICGQPLSDPIWFQSLKKKYVNTAILYELYRQGRFKAAQLFIQESKVKEPKQDKAKFETLHAILHSIDRFDIKPALKWIAENEKKDNDKADINFATKYDLHKYSDILRFLLHRDKFLHISAIGTKQEMHSYMRSELEKLRNAKYENGYTQEIINNLHSEASSIAYYVDDWKLLYYLKIFAQTKLSQIPVSLNAESFEKYSKAIAECNKTEKEQKECKESKESETNTTNDIEMSAVNGNHKKRKNTDDTSDEPRKKRKISDENNVCDLLGTECDREYLSLREKLALYQSFEFPQLISSVWNLSRKAFTAAFISLELDLPQMSGIQSCVELSLSTFPSFRRITDNTDVSGDFDDILSLYKEFNKERIVRTRATFPHSLMSHSDENGSMSNGVSLSNGSNMCAFKWEDYDTLGEDSGSDKYYSENGFDLFSDKSHKKGRFRIHSKKTHNRDEDSKSETQTEDIIDEIIGVSDEESSVCAYGDYDNVNDDMRDNGIDCEEGYIGYMNRKEFKLDLKKRKIIRRSKNKEYKDRMDKYNTAEFLYNRIQPFIETVSNKKKRSKHKLTRPTTIILSARPRTHRYDSRGVQRPHSLPSSSSRHRSRIRTQTTPPPPSDSDANEEAFILHRNRSRHPNQPLNIPHLHRAGAHTHTHSHDRRRLYPQNIVHRSIHSSQFSPPPNNASANHTPLLLGTRVVNENNESNNEDLVGFDNDLSTMLNTGIFASRSSSPLSAQLTLEHLSMANEVSVSEERGNDDMAAQALLLLKNSKSKCDNDNENESAMSECENVNEKKVSIAVSNDKEEIDSDDLKEMDTDNGSMNELAMIDWENESDSSASEERYLTQKDKDLRRNEAQKLKISCKMENDFKMPKGYLSHSIFVCPIQTDYVCDPQTKLGCGHLISYQTFVKLQSLSRQRHQENRNRSLKIHCPNCDQQSDVDKDVRYVYLGRFPNLRTDARFVDILDKNKESLDPSATKWVPGATQINGQE